MTEEWLQKNALWIVMDPWYPHPYPFDYIQNPYINEDIDVMLNKIINYIPKLKHVVISMAKDKKGSRSLHSKIQFIDNIYDKPAYIFAYLKKHSLQHVVYCGFHYGRCILNNSTGAKNISKFYKTYVKKDLCGFIKCKRINSIEVADVITKNYATII